MLLEELKTVGLFEWLDNKNYLYHGTDYESALKIIQSQHLKDTTANRIPGRSATGVSLTRNPRYAQTGSDDVGRRSQKLGVGTIGTDVVFVFNRDVLKNSKKLSPLSQSMGKPYDQTMTKGSAQTEYEEFVEGHIPLDKKHGYIGFYVAKALPQNVMYTLRTSIGYIRSPQDDSVYNARQKLKAKKQSGQELQNAKNNAPSKQNYEDDWETEFKNRKPVNPVKKDSMWGKIRNKLNF